MAATLAQRQAPRAETREEDRPASPLPVQASGSEREWLIFQPTVVSSPSLDSASSIEPASASSESEWQQLDSNRAQIGSLPAHDGQGIFTMDDSEVQQSLYASAQPGWIVPEADASNGSARLSFSTSSSRADIFKPVTVPRTSRSPLRTMPLTEQTLATIPDHRPQRSEEEEEAVLTASSDDGKLSDVEEQLSRTPQAASAGLQLTPRRSRKADHAGIKRRHRKSGLSDKGSKRSNTSSNAVLLAQSARGLPAKPVVERSASDSNRGLLFGKVVRKVFSVDQDLLDMVATSHSAPVERDPPSFLANQTTLPRAPARPNRLLRRMTLDREHGYPAFAKHIREEMGDYSGFAAGLTDSGEETEMDITPAYTPRLANRIRPASTEWHSARNTEALTTRSMSLSSLPQLLESMYSSLPSELFRSNVGSGAEPQPMRRTASLDEGRTGNITPASESVGRLSYWRAFLGRVRATGASLFLLDGTY